MKKLLVALLLLSACNRGGDAGGNGAATTGAEEGRASRQTPAAERGAAGKGLTGLYEGGSGDQKSQLCMIAKGASDQAEFGLVVWGANQHSCLGSGEATRSGERLTLKMAGDETCSIDARIQGGKVMFPANLLAGCDYYCAASATMARATFNRSGSTKADALKARDIAGDPLCD
jgi:hypothetical protein